MQTVRNLAVNELGSLVKRNRQSDIRKLSITFPEFASELANGIPLGTKEKEPTSVDSVANQEISNQAFIEKRAEFALQLSRNVVEVVSARIDTLRNKLSAQRMRKILLLSAGGLSGVATLAAIGFSSAVATSIGAVITSFVAVGNSIHEFLLKGAEHNLESALMNLAKANFSLTILNQELEAALQSHIADSRIERLVNNANSVAEDLNAKATVLGI